MTYNVLMESLNPHSLTLILQNSSQHVKRRGGKQRQPHVINLSVVFVQQLSDRESNKTHAASLVRYRLDVHYLRTVVDGWSCLC